MGLCGWKQVVGSHDVVTNHRISSFSTREQFFSTPTLRTANYPTVCEASKSVRCFYLTWFFPKPQYRGNQCQRQREHDQSNFLKSGTVECGPQEYCNY